MKTHLLVREQATPDRLKGLVLCHDLYNDEGKPILKKGQVLQEEDLPLLQSLPWEELHLVEMEANMVAQENLSCLYHFTPYPERGAQENRKLPPFLDRHYLIDTLLGSGCVRPFIKDELSQTGGRKPKL